MGRMAIGTLVSLELWMIGKYITVRNLFVKFQGKAIDIEAKHKLLQMNLQDYKFFMKLLYDTLKLRLLCLFKAIRLEFIGPSES